MLKLLCGGAPVALIGLQEFRVRSGRLLRLLGPDLLLVPTAEDCDRARHAGVNAARVASGVDLERFRPAAADERTALRRRWGLPGDATVMLHVGHLKDGRNLGLLAPLVAAGATVVLVVSGRRGPESERLKAELTAAGVVVVEGYQPRIEELYRLADCYVFPTASNDSAVAMPLSVLEALASDLPVVSMRFGALAERLGEGPGLELVDDPQRIPERALALAGAPVTTRALAEPFSWNAIMERLVEIFDQLALKGRMSRVGSLEAVSAASDTATTQPNVAQQPPG
jgi:glycosyltransferase involved in cell wall biosynthesis